jgi:hypothetical protein
MSHQSPLFKNPLSHTGFSLLTTTFSSFAFTTWMNVLEDTANTEQTTAGGYDLKTPLDITQISRLLTFGGLIENWISNQAFLYVTRTL